MNTLRKILVLALFALIPTVGAVAQSSCPAPESLGAARIELQHEKLLTSGDPHLEQNALQNIVTLTRKCSGSLTFERLLPKLVRMYEKGDAAKQAHILEAVYAVNDAVGMARLQHLLRGSRHRAQPDGLWTKLVERHRSESRNL